MFTWICGFVCDCWLAFMFYAKKKKKKRKEERQNIMKKTHLSLFLTMKRERWVTGGLIEVTLGRLSDNF